MTSSHPSHRNSGFTLVEVIVVLAVVLLLSGIAVPLISGYVEDSKRARGEAEVKMLAAAVSSVYKDVGIFPSRNSSSSNSTVRCLWSGPTAPTASTFVSSGGHNFYQWAASTTNGDSLDNQLLSNTPQGSSGAAYPTTGNIRWRGPYLAGSSPLDPWGRPYLVNVYSSFNTHNTNNKRIFVLSAGPDGRIDTNERARATDDITGDDIAIILHQRQ
ncbi:MAG: type II secretion system protein GspG [Planctomycetota bacterium]|jgi:prepilin-type N-terminal cleavage/methylation domain-containing protein